jgi:hydrogenase maturation protease
MMSLMATIIIGIGNPVLTDDSVGIKVARALARRLPAQKDTVVRELSAGGLRLMEALEGFERAVIIDAIVTEGGEAGSVYRLTPSDLAKTRNTCSTHDASLGDALELGKSLGLMLPHEIAIWAIEAGDVRTFSEELTGPVEAAVPRVVEAVIRRLNESASGRPGERQ